MFLASTCTLEMLLFCAVAKECQVLLLGCFAGLFSNWHIAQVWHATLAG